MYVEISKHFLTLLNNFIIFRIIRQILVAFSEYMNLTRITQNSNATSKMCDTIVFQQVLFKVSIVVFIILSVAWPLLFVCQSVNELQL